MNEESKSETRADRSSLIEKDANNIVFWSSRILAVLNFWGPVSLASLAPNISLMD